MSARPFDRRWIFLMMAIAVAVPILVIGLTGRTFPETPTPAARAAFDAIEKLPEGTPVLLTFDFDPASAGELQPMATSFVRHCAAKKLKMVFISLWPLGGAMADSAIKRVIESDFPNLVYGTDYVSMGFQAGNEAVMKLLLTDFARAFPSDSRGTPASQLPALKGISRATDFPMVIAVSAGYPGAKEWIQYVISANLGTMEIVTGSTGVQAPQLYPYFPRQMTGILGAIKGAAEYEALVNAKLDGDRVPPAKYLEAQRRMGPQLFAHLLMVGLIIAGNVIYFRQRGAARRGAATAGGAA
jgi:hypothetical protein